MSDHDSEDSISRGRSDLSSDCPRFSVADSTIDLTPTLNRENECDYESNNTDQYDRYYSSQCFKTTPNNFSADQNVIRRGVLSDNNMSGPAPNMGMPVCYAPPVETGHYQKGGEFLEPPVSTTPQRSNAWPSFSSYERVELEGARKSTVVCTRTLIYKCTKYLIS